jgi:hypothetical protein
VVLAWNDGLNRHDRKALEGLYTEHVRYYARELSRSAVLEAKSAAFRATPKFRQQIVGEVSCTIDDYGSVTATFLKRSGPERKMRDVGVTVVVRRDGEGTLRVAEETDNPSERQLVREEKTVVVDGVSETWRLVWREVPEPYCTEPDPVWCDGFTYGEMGDLDLVRLRPSEHEERLNINQVLSEDTMPLQHWVPSGNETDLEPDAIKALPVADVMPLGDYDHDGRATEFVLRLPFLGPRFGGYRSVLVGISKNDPALHVFSSMLPPSEWERIRNP